MNHRPLGYEGDPWREPIHSSLFSPPTINDFGPIRVARVRPTGIEFPHKTRTARKESRMGRMRGRVTSSPLRYGLPTVAGIAAYSRALSGLPQAL